MSEAALLLDTAQPGWYNTVNTGRLDMSSASDDILGNVFGGYDKGIEQLFGNIYDSCDRLVGDTIFGHRADLEQWLAEIYSRREVSANKASVRVGRQVTIQFAGQSISVPIEQLDALIAELQSLRVN